MSEVNSKLRDTVLNSLQHFVELGYLTSKDNRFPPAIRNMVVTSMEVTDVEKNDLVSAIRSYCSDWLEEYQKSGFADIVLKDLGYSIESVEPISLLVEVFNSQFPKSDNVVTFDVSLRFHFKFTQ